MQPGTSHPQSGSSSLLYRPLVHFLLIAGLALLAYANTLHVPFVFDDVKEIVENPVVRNLHYFWNPDAARGLTTYHGLHMRTVAYFTLALNYLVGGTNVVGYHLFNLAVHILTALLVYKLVSRTLGLAFFQKEVQGSTTQNAKLKTQNFVPLLVALLFAVHPIQTEAVTYLIQRLTSLATCFYLLSLTSYIDARLDVEEQRTGRALAWFLVSLVAAVAAMKTKEIAFTLPLVAVLYESVFLRGKLRRRLFLAPLLLTMLIIPVGLVGTQRLVASGQPVASILESANMASRVDHAVSRMDYLSTQFRVIVTYLRMLILPVDQSLDHDYPLHPHFLAPEVLLSFLLLATLFGLGVYLVGRGKYWSRLPGPESRVPSLGSRFTVHGSRIIGFGILWFFITLAVESSIIPIPDVMNEHRLYLPSVGFFLALVTAAWLLVGKLAVRRPGIGRAATALAAVIVLALTAATYSRNRVWQDEIGLWQDVIAKNPQNARAYNNLGSYLDSRGDYAKALPYLQKAIALRPDFAEGLFNLGLANAGLKQKDMAIFYYRQALALQPSNPEVLYNLGVVYMDKGMFAPAATVFQEALRLDPTLSQARMFLQYALQQIGKQTR